MFQERSWPRRQHAGVAGRVRVYVLVATVTLFSSTLAFSQTTINGWQSIAVGAPALPGGALQLPCAQPAAPSCVSVVLAGAGADIWNRGDEMQFVYRPLVGDGKIVARVAGLEATNPSAKVGVMIRESLSAASRHAFTVVTARKGVYFQRRKSTGGTSASTAAVSAAAPLWLRLDRTGTTFTSSISVDGATWNVVGSDVIPLGETVYAGVAVTSHDPLTRALALVTDTVARSVLPANWAAADIGAPATAGRTAFFNGAFIISSTSRDTGRIADQFRYTYQQVSGDVSVLTRVPETTRTGTATVGVMVRESLAADAANAGLLLASGNSLQFERRFEQGQPNTVTSLGQVTAPGWLKVEKRGDTLTAMYSADGSLWRVMGSEVIAMPTTFYVGLAVASGDPATETQASFDNTAVRALDAPVVTRSSLPGDPSPNVQTPPPATSSNAAPSVAITAPFDTVTVPPGTSMTLAADASDSDGSIVGVDFYVDTELVGTATVAPFTANWTALAIGTHLLRAVARDDEGATTASAVRTITVATTIPTYVQFAPSRDHDSLVTSYAVEVFAASADRSSAPPVASQSIGKPVVVDGICQADISAQVAPLPPGSYVAVVYALGDAGRSAAAVSAAFSR